MAIMKHTARVLKGTCLSEKRRGSIMPISPELLEILACPACKAKVELKADGSGLKCVKCKRVYPIRDDIPVMLVDEATVEDEEPSQ